MKPQSLFSIVALLALTTQGHGQGATPRPTPPPEPRVKPIISVDRQVDKDEDRLSDAIEDKLTSAERTMRMGSASLRQTDAAKADILEPVAMEFVFSKQITQAQIDTFIAAGGKFDKIFTHVSYGWVGQVSREKAAELATSLGDSLLMITEPVKAELHMDEAGRTGQVRPWTQGVRGDGVGTDRVTVAIVDSGVDGTHTDLTGRMEYWKDWTTDNLATPQDAGGHGSHVAGIAIGSGAASGVSPTQLKYTDISTIFSGGSFSPSPLHIPASVSPITWNSSVEWQTGLGTTQIQVHHIERTAGGYFSRNGIGAAASPATLNSVFNRDPSSLSHMAAILLLAGTGDVAKFANRNTVSYAGVGDGFNALSGVAPESKWAGFKVFTNAGSGNSGNIASAIDDIVAQASSKNIRVANFSLGLRDLSGNPTSDAFIRSKINTLAANGIIPVCSAGNDGENGTGTTGMTGDPGRANYAITVAAASDVNQITSYSSHGFLAGDGNIGDEDIKPDIAAPGGSLGQQSGILSIDSNTADGPFADGVLNDYTNMQGTSMASPFIAGCAALVVDAMQRKGETWDSLADVLKAKMFLLMTATETNKTRETGGLGANPVLNRGGKDIEEGYGMVNAKSAIDAVMVNPVVPAAFSDTFPGTETGNRCSAYPVTLAKNRVHTFTMLVPGTGDFDAYLYSSTPDTYGNPVILASSTNPGSAAEIVPYTSTALQTAYLVVKRVSGSGTWNISTTIVPAASVEDAFLY